MGWFDQPLGFGKLIDCGMVEYHEFACSVETFEWLQAGAMTHLDGEPVRLVVVERPSVHNVIVQAVTQSFMAGVKRERHQMLIAA